MFRGDRMGRKSRWGLVSHLARTPAPHTPDYSLKHHKPGLQPKTGSPWTDRPTTSKEEEIMAVTARGRCGKPIKTRDENAGKRLMCPGCGSTVEVPRPVAAGAPSGATV